MAEGERPRRRGLWIGVVAVALGAVLATGGAEPGGAANQAVSGRVTIDGVGYAGIGVTTSGNSQTFTDATGTFHSTVIDDPGSIEVDVDEWRTGVPMPIVTELWVFGVAFSAGPVDIDLPPPAALTVRVREEDGTPVSGATVFSNHSDLTGITHPGTRAQLHTQSNAETGASGDVTLEDMVGLTDVRVVHSVDGVHREVTIPDVPVTDGHELTCLLYTSDAADE